MSKFWFKVRDDIFDLKLNKHEILIYVYLAKLCNQTGRCTVRHNTIAQKTDTSLATVKRALNTLYQKKLVVKKNREFGANEYILVNKYTVQLPKDPPITVPPEEKQEYQWYNWLDTK